MATLELNTRAEVPVEFREADSGALVDPGTVRVKIRTPQKEISTITHPNASITKDGVGLYRTSILFDKPGKWLVRWEGLSSNEVSEEIPITVNGSDFYDGDGDALPDS